jgi:hypothetical protein
MVAVVGTKTTILVVLVGEELVEVGGELAAATALCSTWTSVQYELIRFRLLSNMNFFDFGYVQNERF